MPAGTAELVMATDSRLYCGGGETWDACPKLLALPRVDAMVCFAGETIRAYPLMLQLQSSIACYPDSQKGILDFDEMVGHAVRVINYQLSMVKHADKSDEKYFLDELSGSSFILCGYSWRRKKFRIIIISFDLKKKQYQAIHRKVKSNTCVFIGDTNARENIPATAFDRLRAKLRTSGKLKGRSHWTLDWEPFEVMRDLIRDGVFDTVGGPIQVAKIYQYLKSQPFAVYWPSKEKGQLTINGRPTLEYEATDWPRLDAATLDVSGISLTDK
jgi:hypothetical protein